MRIITENLSYTYSEKSKALAVQALKDVSLTIEEGEFFGIVGKTGSGKSTLIQHFNGLIPLGKNNGKIIVGDIDLSQKKPDYKKLRANVGMVFQYPEYQLFAETIEEDVAFGIKNFLPNISEQEKKQLVKNAINAVGLDYEKVKDKSPFELSGGQKRRVAIAGVIVTRPQVLVLDEPAPGFQHVDDHLDQRLGREEHTVVRGDVLGEFIEEILVDTADDVAAHRVQRVVVENAQELGEKLVREHGVVFGKHASELFALLFHQIHGVVHHFAKAVQLAAGTGGQLGGGDILRQGDKVGITGLFGQEERAFFAEVLRLDGKRNAAPHGAILEKFGLHQLEAAVRVAQEQQAQHRHAVLVGGELGTRAEQVGRFPEVGFQFLEALVVHESPFRAMLIISSTGRHGW